MSIMAGRDNAEAVVGRNVAAREIEWSGGEEAVSEGDDADDECVDGDEEKCEGDEDEVEVEVEDAAGGAEFAAN